MDLSHILVSRKYTLALVFAFFFSFLAVKAQNLEQEVVVDSVAAAGVVEEEQAEKKFDINSFIFHHI
ncbi:F0F1 ATP synthase subunit A, partial [Pseudoxanthomonas sp. SGD-10]